jgi:hypothetical protein
MKPICTCLYVYIMIIFSCVPPERKSSGALEHMDKKAENKPVCYVLCDVSTSLNSADAKTARHHAEAIFRRAKGYDFKYFDISDAFFKRSFFEYEAPVPGQILTPTERERIKRAFSSNCDRLHQILENLYHSPSSNTCIIRTIRKVANSIAADNKAELKEIKIVILSDMLEDCANDFGKIDIGSGDFKAATRTLSGMPTPNFSFSGYRNIEVSIVVTSEQNIGDDSPLFSFWKTMFKKYGYDLNKPITPDLPGWLPKDDERTE